MIDYLNITSDQQKRMMDIFSLWIDWFVKEVKLDPNEPIYSDIEEVPFTIHDYIKSVKTTFGFQNPCKEYLSLSFISGGKDSVLTMIRKTAPLVIEDFTPHMIEKVAKAS